MGGANGMSGPAYRIAGGLALVAAIQITPAHATADANYLSMIVGERPMGMGGAYIAVADDPSGLYYNPAGIVYGHAPNLSASVNALHMSETRYANALGDADWVRESSELLPNFFGTVQPLGPLTVGFSYAVPRSVREDQAQTFTNVDNEAVEYFSINVDNSDTINQIGPSVAMELTDRLSVGGTVYLHQRDQKSIVTQVFRLDEANIDSDVVHEVQNLYTTRAETALNWRLGTIWTPTTKLAIGATLRGTRTLSGTRTDQDFVGRCSNDDDTGSVVDVGCLDPDMTFHDRTEYESRPSHPIELGVGLAWFASQRLLLAGDANYYTAVDERESVLNFAGGGEYYLNQTWAMRLGGYTNYANTPDVRTGLADHQVDRYGITGSLTRFSRNSSVSVGANYSMGSGEARIIDVEGLVQEVSTSSLTLFLATSYSY